MTWCSCHAEICPICKGSGEVEKYDPQSTASSFKRACHGCLGVGWITVAPPRPLPVNVTITLDGVTLDGVTYDNLKD